jgi:predicted Fe-S protein YdhL (DUF1289 family)
MADPAGDGHTANGIISIMHLHSQSTPLEISTEGRQSTDGATDGTTSHLTKLHKPQQVIGYSHPTKQPKDGCQMVGYVQQVEREIVTTECPCTGHCTTALGDDVCRSCLRTFDEITRWPQMSEEERSAVNRRIAQE